MYKYENEEEMRDDDDSLMQDDDEEETGGFAEISGSSAVASGTAGSSLSQQPSPRNKTSSRRAAAAARLASANNIRVGRHRFTDAEDEKLVQAVESQRFRQTNKGDLMGLGYDVKWAEIAREVFKGVFTKFQIRQRFVMHLHPKISRGPWTDPEDKKLLYLHSKHGNCWSAISEEFNYSRSPMQCSDRYRVLMKRKQNGSLGWEPEKWVPSEEERIESEVPATSAPGTPSTPVSASSSSMSRSESGSGKKKVEKASTGKTVAAPKKSEPSAKKERTTSIETAATTRLASSERVATPTQMTAKLAVQSGLVSSPVSPAENTQQQLFAPRTCVPLEQVHSYDNTLFEDGEYIVIEEFLDSEEEEDCVDEDNSFDDPATVDAACMLHCFEAEHNRRTSLASIPQSPSVYTQGSPRLSITALSEEGSPSFERALDVYTSHRSTGKRKRDSFELMPTTVLAHGSVVPQKAYGDAKKMRMEALDATPEPRLFAKQRRP